MRCASCTGFCFLWKHPGSAWSWASSRLSSRPVGSLKGTTQVLLPLKRSLKTKHGEGRQKTKDKERGSEAYSTGPCGGGEVLMTPAVCGTSRKESGTAMAKLSSTQEQHCLGVAKALPVLSQQEASQCFQSALQMFRPQ